MPQEFEWAPFRLDHIIAEQHGGRTVLSNLRFAGPAVVSFHSLGYKDSAKALRLIRKVPESQRTSARYYFYLGQIYDDLDQLDNAIIAYKKCLEIDTDEWLPYWCRWYFLGNLCRRAGRFEEAM